MIRRALGLACAVLMVLAGAAGLVVTLFFAAGFKGWAIMASAAVMCAGAYWLYEDYIRAFPYEEV